MIPTGGAGIVQLFQTQHHSKTYRIDHENKRIVGIVDGIEAVKQAVYKIMQTERFEHLVYGPDYGGEYKSLIGKRESYVRSEIWRRIEESLLQDDRITAIEDMKITVTGDSALAEFTVVSKYGRFQSTKEVLNRV
ncbi:DUF2634 domain-containing protein [Paenibacillus sp. LMG 31461]|uniref:DUF2634 domain-containing protein n=1 Tax=Paenibacillus plantarum TaxID=2654975 RepID=A0ABX1XJD2_9BACL|nr:DUF2634 domain-containing protein [Paenibacillus plantarum]NOU68394.1 DUF2634 domain-containing protein [Paenibacillus plantarum]